MEYRKFLSRLRIGEVRMYILKKLFIVCAIGLIAIVGASCSGNGEDNNGGDTLYYIGGNVNGLSGTLVLQNNGSDDLTIGLDGQI
jgi:hypothetical protein